MRRGGPPRPPASQDEAARSEVRKAGPSDPCKWQEGAGSESWTPPPSRLLRLPGLNCVLVQEGPRAPSPRLQPHLENSVCGHVCACAHVHVCTHECMCVHVGGHQGWKHRKLWALQIEGRDTRCYLLAFTRRRVLGRPPPAPHQGCSVAVPSQGLAGHSLVLHLLFTAKDAEPRAGAGPLGSLLATGRRSGPLPRGQRLSCPSASSPGGPAFITFHHLLSVWVPSLFSAAPGADGTVSTCVPGPAPPGTGPAPQQVPPKSDWARGTRRPGTAPAEAAIQSGTQTRVFSLSQPIWKVEEVDFKGPAGK